VKNTSGKVWAIFQVKKNNQGKLEPSTTHCQTKNLLAKLGGLGGDR